MYSSFSKIVACWKDGPHDSKIFQNPSCMLSWKEANKIESYLVTVGMHAQTHF